MLPQKLALQLALNEEVSPFLAPIFHIKPYQNSADFAKRKIPETVVVPGIS